MLRLASITITTCNWSIGGPRDGFTSMLVAGFFAFSGRLSCWWGRPKPILFVTSCISRKASASSDSETSLSDQCCTSSSASSSARCTIAWLQDQCGPAPSLSRTQAMAISCNCAIFPAKHKLVGPWGLEHKSRSMTLRNTTRRAVSTTSIWQVNRTCASSKWGIGQTRKKQTVCRGRETITYTHTHTYIDGESFQGGIKCFLLIQRGKIFLHNLFTNIMKFDVQHAKVFGVWGGLSSNYFFARHFEQEAATIQMLIH